MSTCTHIARNIRPSASAKALESFDASVQETLTYLLEVSQLEQKALQKAALPLSSGGLGLKSLFDSRFTDYLAAVADVFRVAQIVAPNGKGNEVLKTWVADSNKDKLTEQLRQALQMAHDLSNAEIAIQQEKIKTANTYAAMTVPGKAKSFLVAKAATLALNQTTRAKFPVDIKTQLDLILEGKLSLRQAAQHKSIGSFLSSLWLWSRKKPGQFAPPSKIEAAKKVLDDYYEEKRALRRQALQARRQRQPEPTKKKNTTGPPALFAQVVSGSPKPAQSAQQQQQLSSQPSTAAGDLVPAHQEADQMDTDADDTADQQPADQSQQHSSQVQDTPAHATGQDVSHQANQSNQPSNKAAKRHTSPPKSSSPITSTQGQDPPLPTVLPQASSVAAAPVSFTSILPQSIAGLWGHTLPRKLQQSLTQAAGKVAFAKLFSSLDNYDRAILLSSSQDGASAFLKATPSCPALQIAPKDFTLILRMWLMTPVLPFLNVDTTVDRKCVCSAGTLKKNARLTERHILNCPVNDNFSPRHNHLVKDFIECAESLQIKTSAEDRVDANVSRNRSDFILYKFLPGSENAVFDVTVVNTLRVEYVRKAASVPLHCASQGWNAKKTKFSRVMREKNPEDTGESPITPVVFESYGAFHPEVFNILKALSGRCHNQAPPEARGMATTFTSYWAQRLSVTLMKENAWCIKRFAKANKDFADTGKLPLRSDQFQRPPKE